MISELYKAIKKGGHLFIEYHVWIGNIKIDEPHLLFFDKTPYILLQKHKLKL